MTWWREIVELMSKQIHAIESEEIFHHIKTNIVLTTLTFHSDSNNNKKLT